MNNTWIGVDLDGTLAYYDKWVAWNIIGKPIPLMLERIKSWIDQGKTVKIFTARVAFNWDTCKVDGYTFTKQEMIETIQDWLQSNGLPRLHVTATKDFNMIELWDDRCIQVVPNTGRTLTEEHLAEITALKGKP